MLESVRLQRFRCFEDAVVRLGALTALVGPNASGKTALLQAIASETNFNVSDVRHRDGSSTCTIEWRSSKGSARQRFDRSTGEGESQHAGQYLHFDVRAIREPRQVTEARKLTTDGSNLVNVLATLPRNVQSGIAEQLARLVPVLSDFHTRPHGRGEHRLVFQDRWNEDLWYEPSRVSDGTLLTLALLSIGHQSEPPDVVCIEEPEHGLHPHLLGEIVAMLRRVTDGAVGPRPIQVVLATQSAEVLEHLEAHEVRFLARDRDDGSVTVEEAPTDTEDWRDAYETYQESLGGMWLSGALGGVPGG